MFAELRDNRERIVQYTSREPKHFCYTAGFHLPEYPQYLKEYGMLSATTCETGLCTAATNPMLLPRLVDTSALSELEFCSWLDGTSDLIPRRRIEQVTSQLVEEN